MMNALEIIRGNTAELTIEVLNPDGTSFGALTGNLTGILFMAKGSKDDANTDAVINISMNMYASQFTLDSPAAGKFKLKLTPTQTDIPKGVYVFAVEITTTAGDKYELGTKINNSPTTQLKVVEGVIKSS